LSFLSTSTRPAINCLPFICKHDYPSYSPPICPNTGPNTHPRLVLSTEHCPTPSPPLSVACARPSLATL
jgi:hypothetical protein